MAFSLLKASQESYRLPQSGGIWFWPNELPRGFFFIYESGQTSHTVYGPFATQKLAELPAKHRTNHLNRLPADATLLKPVCLFESGAEWELGALPTEGKLSTPDARSIFRRICNKNRHTNPAERLELTIRPGKAILATEGRFPYYLEEKPLDLPGYRKGFAELMRMLQESEMSGFVDADSLHHQAMYLLDRFLDSDSTIRRQLLQLNDDSNGYDGRYLLVNSLSEGEFPIELFPQKSDRLQKGWDFLGLNFPVLRRKRLRTEMTSHTVRLSNTSGNLFVFCNPGGDEPLEYAGREADEVFEAALASDLFRKIIVIREPLSASQFYKHLSWASVVYYVGHGFMGEYGPEIPLSSGLISLASVRSLLNLPQMFFFSACFPRPLLKLDQNPANGTPAEFPALQAIYPHTKVKDSPVSFPAQLFKELTAGATLAQSTLACRRQLFTERFPGWASWLVQGWPSYRLQDMRKYRMHR